MHPSFVRHVHAMRILHAIRLSPGITQRQLGEVCQTDKSTVSAIVKSFEDAGLLERMTPAQSHRRGRPSEGLAISSDWGLLAGVHLNLDETRFVLAGLDGKPLTALVMPTPEPEGLDSFVRNGVRALVAAVGRNEADVRAVGVSVPGLVTQQGELSQSPNLTWRGVNLRTILERTIDQPLFIDNDSNGATLAEDFFARSLDAGDFVFIQSGSGVGGGIFVDGMLHRGAMGFAGEIGHMKIVPDGRPCRCGGAGCLDTYTSDISVVERAREAGLNVKNTAEVAELAAAGNSVVRNLLERNGRYLGFGLANVVNLLNPREIVLGGGYARLSEYLLPSTERAMHENVIPALIGTCKLSVSPISGQETPLDGIAIALDGCTNAAESGLSFWRSELRT